MAVVPFLSSPCKISWKNCVYLLYHILPFITVYFSFLNFLHNICTERFANAKQITTKWIYILPPLNPPKRPFVSPFQWQISLFSSKATVIFLLTANSLYCFVWLYYKDGFGVLLLVSFFKDSVHGVNFWTIWLLKGRSIWPLSRSSRTVASNCGTQTTSFSIPEHCSANLNTYSVSSTVITSQINQLLPNSKIVQLHKFSYIFQFKIELSHR